MQFSSRNFREDRSTNAYTGDGACAHQIKLESMFLALDAQNYRISTPVRIGCEFSCAVN